MTALSKPCRTARKKAERKTKLKRKSDEGENKKQARKRDLHRCRFPLCGCRKFGLPLEAAHLQHKGAGGNPTGSRSTRAGLILMCRHRHQYGAVALHKGILRVRPLTRQGCDGPVAFDIDAVFLAQHAPGQWSPANTEIVATAIRSSGWFEIARERAVQQLDAMTFWQQRILTILAEMDL